MYVHATIAAVLAAAALASPVAEQQGKAPRAEKCNSNICITATSSTTITTTITRASKAPRAFSLLYSDASSTTQNGHISTPSDRPGSSGTLITFKPDQALPDIFALNAQKQLTTSSGDLVLEKNNRDPFPYLFLDNGTTAANSPVFSVCEGRLRAEYPGTQGNGFAVCDGFLALVVEAVFTEPSCRKINLGFGEVPLAQNQRE